MRRAVAALAAQTVNARCALEIVAVDNASEDGTADVLVELLGPERVLLADVDLGFPAAVDLALDAIDARDARDGRAGLDEEDLVLLVHDDLVLAPDAVERLVDALRSDDRLAIVGPKLRWADEPERLQSVGATIDITGRVDDGLDPGELDQGQRDGDRRVLFVSTAGMLVRRRVFEELGRFDPRAHAFREDLDLCWRATIAGHDVEVVPGAVGLHAARAAEHRRTGRVAELGPRYLAERNTLTALLTNYGAERLVRVLPLALLVGVAKVAGFLLTRRFSDARATIAAWGWNVVNLPGTLQRRRRVQRSRRRSDDDVALLLGRIMPRAQAYLEAVADRLLGDSPGGDLGTAETQPSAMLQGELVGDVRDEPAATGSDAPLLDGGPDEEPRRRAFARRLRARPLQVLLPVPAVLLVVGLRDALLSGPLRGGDVRPLPEGPSLIARHLADWHDSGATLTLLDPSPAQLVLGALQWIAGGAALRVLLLLAPLVAWALAIRALAPHLPDALPRTVLALAYAVSPPIIGALAAGDVVTIVVAIAVPLLAVAGNTILAQGAPVERVWRRIAVATLVLAIVVAFAPQLIIVLPAILIAGVGHAVVAVDDPTWRRTLLLRSAALALLPLPLLGPWLRQLPDVLRAMSVADGITLGGHPLAWLALDPSGRLLGMAGIGLLVAGTAGALVVSAATVGATTYRAVVAMHAVAIGAPLLAWGADGAALGVRPGPLLVIAAGALVGAATVGLRHAPEVLARHAFGWRQLGVGAASVATVLLVAVGLVQHAILGTPGLTRTEAVPAYVATLGPDAPDRVLVLGETTTGVVWEIVPATGPDLAAFGVRHDPVVHEQLTAAVDDLLAGRDPRAAARLGRLGVGVVLVPGGFEDPDLDALLRQQSALDPLPTLDGRVARVLGAVPRAAVVRDITDVDRVPDPSVPPRTVIAALDRVAPDRAVGMSGTGGELLATVPFGMGWQVRVDGELVPMLSEDGLVRVRDVPADVTVELVAGEDPLRPALLQLQALWALVVLSLGARPPALARRAGPRSGGRGA